MKLEHQLCFEVYKASSNFSKLYARTLEPFGLTFTQYLVLVVLWEEDRQLGRDIGARLGLGTGTLNPIFSRMIERGWLVKQPSETDRRASIISLTGEAKAAQAAIEQAIYEKITSCNYLDVRAEELMKNLKGLNAFFAEMDL